MSKIMNAQQGPIEFYKIIKIGHSDVRWIFLNSISFSGSEDIVATSNLMSYITLVIVPFLLQVFSDITGTTLTTAEK